MHVCGYSVMFGWVKWLGLCVARVKWLGLSVVRVLCG